MIVGVVARDSIENKSYKIMAKGVINATGVFSDSITNLDIKTKKTIVPSQGVHIVLDKSFLAGNHAIMVPHTTDYRVLFTVPWNNYVIVGTTDTQIERSNIEPTPLREEIKFILKNAGSYMKSAPSFKDIKVFSQV